MSEKRNNTIDIAKGIGIILVVAGHNTYFMSFHEFIRVIYSFHMPLFFFLAGIFLKDKESFIDFFVSKFDHLLKPYLSVLLIFGLAKILAGKESWAHLLGIAYATGATVAWVQMWFLPHMFVSLLLSLFLIKALKAFKLTSRFFLPSIALCVIAVGAITLNSYYKYDTRGLPWSLDIASLSAGYLILGYSMREFVKHFKFNLPTFTAALVIFVLLHVYSDVSMDMNLREFGLPYVVIPQSLLGIYLIISISTSLSQYKFTTLSYIGANSLFIFIFHGYSQQFFYKTAVNALNDQRLSGIISFAASIICSLIIMKLVYRSKIASALIVPMKKSPKNTKPILHSHATR